MRDPLRHAPALHRPDECGGWIVASETCALDHLGAEFVREVEPGEIIVIDKDGLARRAGDRRPPQTRSVLFEYIYFARPDSRSAASSSTRCA